MVAFGCPDMPRLSAEQNLQTASKPLGFYIWFRNLPVYVCVHVCVPIRVPLSIGTREQYNGGTVPTV